MTAIKKKLDIQELVFTILSQDYCKYNFLNNIFAICLQFAGLKGIGETIVTRIIMIAPGIGM